jgi:hypothetical protein
MRGCDFIPSTAINQLEMWQAETFDTVTINRELGWAQNIGMNIMRVYLHHLAWQIDSAGFKKRMDKYLSIPTSMAFLPFLFFSMIAGILSIMQASNPIPNLAFIIPDGCRVQAPLRWQMNVNIRG